MEGFCVWKISVVVFIIFHVCIKKEIQSLCLDFHRESVFISNGEQINGVFCFQILNVSRCAPKHQHDVD